MPNVRAVHIISRLNVGGIARYLAMGADAVDVLVRGAVGPGETEATWNGEQRFIPDLGRTISLRRDRAAYRAIIRVLEETQPDVVHTHASKGGALGRLAARRMGIPTVHTFHGHVLRGYFGFMRSRVFRSMERRLARHSTITATGPKTASDLATILRVPVSVLEPGIELPPPTVDLRSSWGAPRKVALMVARPAAIKQPDRFVAAASSAGYLPVIAGMEGVPGALCLGTVERMEDVYASCDVVVCASAQEGTPFSVLEAMWCGKPVVAHPVGDIEWILGDCGITTWDLESALRDVPADLGQRAARRVREQFPASAVAPRFRAFYAKLRA